MKKPCWLCDGEGSFRIPFQALAQTCGLCHGEGEYEPLNQPYIAATIDGVFISGDAQLRASDKPVLDDLKWLAMWEEALRSNHAS